MTDMKNAGKNYWRNWYIVVAGLLLLQIILFYMITEAFA
jgi:hypothetical protein